MSVFPRESLHRVSHHAQDSAKMSEKVDRTDRRFKDCLKVSRVDDQKKTKNFFDFVQEEEEKTPLQAGCISSSSLCAMEATSDAVISRATALSADVEAAYEKMASQMIIMHASGDQETILYLDSAQFSTLFGTKIVIKEFSTAPKAFNIEIISNPQAVALMDASKAHLMATFQNGNFPFSVNQLDAHLEERPVFCRKEAFDQQQHSKEEHA